MGHNECHLPPMQKREGFSDCVRAVPGSVGLQFLLKLLRFRKGFYLDSDPDRGIAAR